MKLIQQDQINAQLRTSRGKIELYKNRKGDILITEKHEFGLFRAIVDTQANISAIGSGPVDTKKWTLLNPAERACRMIMVEIDNNPALHNDSAIAKLYRIAEQGIERGA